MAPYDDELPGGVAISRLSVYDWPADEEDCGGTPRMHLACSEAYVVIGGRGIVQTLTASGFEATPLRPGTVTWLTPGTIHRLVNQGDLRITVLVQNSGLPEAGDAVPALPPEYLTRGGTGPHRPCPGGPRHGGLQNVAQGALLVAAVVIQQRRIGERAVGLPN